jgi:hypothetical protein
LQDDTIRQPKHVHTQPIQISILDFIFSCLTRPSMGSPIQFDRKLEVDTIKINGVPANRMLASKLESRQMTVP